MNVIESMPKELSDALVGLAITSVTWLAYRVKNKVAQSAPFKKAAESDQAVADVTAAVEKARAELVKERYELVQDHEIEAARWEQRNKDLSDHIKELIVQAQTTADLHSAALAQLGAYVNKLLSENNALREDVAEYRRNEENLRREFNDYRAMFERREEAMNAERNVWKNAMANKVHAEREREQSAMRKMEKGQPLSSTDVMGDR